MKKVCLTIRFANDSSEQRLFNSVREARRFAREHVSYSSPWPHSAVVLVYVTDEYDHDTTLWKRDWDAVSKYHSLYDVV